MSARTLMLTAAVALFAVGAQAQPRSSSGVAVYSSRPAAEASRSGGVDGFVLLTGGNSTDMNGSMDDVRRARALRTGGGPLLYVRQGGGAYVIRDPATLRRAQALFEPQEALGRRQAELGSRQAELGRQQAGLGRQQAALGYRQVGDSPREAADLASRQAELGRQQGLLGAQQAELGRRQSELGRQQSEAARVADGQIRDLFAEALRSGLAQRVD